MDKQTVVCTNNIPLFIHKKEWSIDICAAAAAAAKSLQSCPTLCDPIDGSQPGCPSLGFSRQEHWSGLPFPSPMHESEKWTWIRSAVSGSLPGSATHGIFQARVLEWGAIAFSMIYVTQTLTLKWKKPYEKGYTCMIPPIWNILNRLNSLGTESRLVVAQDQGKGRTVNDCLLETWVSFCGHGMFWN